MKLLQQYLIIKNSGLFDSEYYLHTYSRDLNANNNPLTHFIKFGWQEGKNPSTDFDTNFYLNHNPDVRESGINPLIHYITQGEKEGRAPKYTPYKTYPLYEKWIKKYDQISKREIIQIKNEINQFRIYPHFLILLINNDKIKYHIDKTLNSLRNQIYENWEAIIISPENSPLNFSLTSHNQSKEDPRINFFSLSSQDKIHEILNKKIAVSHCHFICLIDDADLLSSHALFLFANEINDHPNAQIIYVDEDKIDIEGKRCDPYFKPDWNPDLFLSQNYLQHTCFYRKETMQKVGGFQPLSKGLEDRELILHISEAFSSPKIRHIPFVLFHRQVNKEYKVNQKINPISDCGINIIKSHYEQHDGKVELKVTERGSWHVKYPIPKPKPLVNIIIPTKNAYDLLSSCINSIRNKSSYKNFEILIVNNQSNHPKVLDYFTCLSEEQGISILDYEHPFNYSSINNFGAKHTKGKVLIFLNNDTEIITPSWIEELISHALRPNIGAVGAMLYYPNDTIQHAGIILNQNNIAGNAYLNEPRGYKGQEGRASMVQNLSAVTGACLAIEKKKFEAVGGFDETHLPIAYNDVDLCLRLLEAGYRNLWTPYAELYHQESATRNDDISLSNKSRLEDEAKYMREKWGEFLANDPAYNLNLSNNYPLFSLAFPPRVTKPWRNSLGK